MIIEEKTTLEAWKKALKHVLNKGIDFKDENSRICREVFNLVINIKEPEHGITKPISILNKSRIWKYPPLDEMASIMLSKKLAPEYSYSYGPRLFNFQGKINQIDDFIIPLLKNVRSSRRATAVLWDPVEDSNTLKRDIPGLILVDFKLRNNKLNTTAVIRSNDLFFGWSANIYQIFILSRYIRKELNCSQGFITTISVSAHIFEDQFGYIKKVLNE